MAAEIVKSFHNSEFLRALNLKVKALSSDAAGTVLSNLQESPTSHLIIRGWVVPSSLSDSTVRKEKKINLNFHMQLLLTLLLVTSRKLAPQRCMGLEAVFYSAKNSDQMNFSDRQFLLGFFSSFSIWRADCI